MIPNLASVMLLTDIAVSVAAHKLRGPHFLGFIDFIAFLPMQNSAPVNPNL